MNSGIRRYVSPATMELLAREFGPESYEGAEREVTVLLADIKKFTPFAEQKQPTEVIRILNEYFAVIVPCIFRYHGTLDKFIGDCVMAVFGTPYPTSHHARNAILAAWDILRAVARLNFARAARNEETLQVGIAVNSGPVIGGYLGAGDRRDFSVIGDTVNLTSRIEDHVTRDEILLGARTYAIVRGQVVAEKLPPVTVKGKREFVQMYRVASVKPGEWSP